MWALPARVIRRILSSLAFALIIACTTEVGLRLHRAFYPVARKQFHRIDMTGLAVPSWTVGVENQPNRVARFTRRGDSTPIEIRTNALGLRGGPVDPRPSPDVFRVLVLGDETVFAPDVSEEQSFCGVLQDLVSGQAGRPVEVINAGIPGACPLTELALLQQRLFALEPNVIVVHADMSDVADDYQYRRFATLDRTNGSASITHPQLAGGQRNRPANPFLDEFLLVSVTLQSFGDYWRSETAKGSFDSRDYSEYPYSWMADPGAAHTLAIEQTWEPLGEIQQLARKSSIPLVLVTSPKPWQVSATAGSKEMRRRAGLAPDVFITDRHPMEVIQEVADRYQINLVDGTKVIPVGKTSDELFLTTAPRLSAKGHAQLGTQLAQAIAPYVGTQRVPRTTAQYGR